MVFFIFTFHLSFYTHNFSSLLSFIRSYQVFLCDIHIFFHDCSHLHSLLSTLSLLSVHSTEFVFTLILIVLSFYPTLLHNHSFDYIRKWTPHIHSFHFPLLLHFSYNKSFKFVAIIHSTLTSVD